MAKVSFTIESDATLQTLFVLPVTDPESGQLIPLKKKDGKRSGSVELEQGKHHYLIRLEAGAPGADWTVTVQRDDKKPIERTGMLDKKGNGGDVGQITVL
jgi:hypothetical protein